MDADGIRSNLALVPSHARVVPPSTERSGVEGDKGAGRGRFLVNVAFGAHYNLTPYPLSGSAMHYPQVRAVRRPLNPSFPFSHASGEKGRKEAERAVFGLPFTV